MVLGIKHHLELTGQRVESGRHRLTSKFSSGDTEEAGMASLSLRESTPRSLDRADGIRLFRLHSLGEAISPERCQWISQRWSYDATSVIHMGRMRTHTTNQMLHFGSVQISLCGASRLCKCVRTNYTYQGLMELIMVA